MINIFSYLIVLVFGLIVGSFLNCVIYRLEINASFMRGRSFCPHCRHNLDFWDLIPVFSFIFLKGRCQYCQKPISWQYPIVEIATGLLFLLIFNFQCSMNFQFISPSISIFSQFSIFNFLNLIYYWIIACFLIIIFVYDLKHYLIPDKVVYPAIALALIFNFQFSIFKFSILSALGAAAFFLFIVLMSRGRWMGTGDIFLAFLMGLILGWPNILVALSLAFFIGAVVGVGLMALNKKTLKSEIPFGPFLILGTFLALFWGSEIVSWYQSLFLL